MHATILPKSNTIQYQGSQAVLPLFPRGLVDKGAPQLFWGHGWGVDHRTLVPIAQSFDLTTAQTLFDFPGFGVARLPPTPWGTEDYADLVAEYLQTLPGGKKIWIGHSFGVRVGLRVAAQYPELLNGMFLIAGAGLKRQRNWRETISYKSKIYAYKTLKPLIQRNLLPEALKNQFGSADYRAAGPLRRTFSKVIQEDLTETARKVQCPVYLVYGAEDRETPPEMGKRFAQLIPNAQISILNHLDHHSILSDGQSQVSYLLKQFLQNIGVFP